MIFSPQNKPALWRRGKKKKEKGILEIHFRQFYLMKKELWFNWNEPRDFVPENSPILQTPPTAIPLILMTNRENKSQGLLFNES